MERIDPVRLAVYVCIHGYRAYLARNKSKLSRENKLRAVPDSLNS